MPPLHDHQQLPLGQPVDLLVGPAQVGDDRQPRRLLVEQDRVVGGDDLAVVVADQRGPGVLANQLADEVRVVAGKQRVGPHRIILTGYSHDVV